MEGEEKEEMQRQREGTGDGREEKEGIKRQSKMGGNGKKEEEINSNSKKKGWEWKGGEETKEKGRGNVERILSRSLSLRLPLGLSQTLSV